MESNKIDWTAVIKATVTFIVTVATAIFGVKIF